MREEHRERERGDVLSVRLRFQFEDFNVGFCVCVCVCVCMCLGGAAFVCVYMPLPQVLKSSNYCTVSQFSPFLLSLFIIALGILSVFECICHFYMTSPRSAKFDGNQVRGCDGKR